MHIYHSELLPAYADSSLFLHRANCKLSFTFKKIKPSYTCIVRFLDTPFSIIHKKACVLRTSKAHMSYCTDVFMRAPQQFFGEESKYHNRLIMRSWKCENWKLNHQKSKYGAPTSLLQEAGNKNSRTLYYFLERGKFGSEEVLILECATSIVPIAPNASNLGQNLRGQER